MKRITATLAAASLFAVTPIMSSPAFAAGSPGDTAVVDRCVASAQANQYPNSTLGNCISLLTIAPLYFSGTGGYGIFTPQICRFFMNNEPDAFYAVYDSYDECILDTATQLP